MKSIPVYTVIYSIYYTALCEFHLLIERMKSESPLMPSILVFSHIIYRISYCLTDEQVESVV